jgi:hypothetical protein
MSFTNNKLISAQFIEEVLNRGDLDKLKNLISPNIVWHGQYKKVKGLKSLKKWLSLERSIFPDMQFRIVDSQSMIRLLLDGYCKLRLKRNQVIIRNYKLWA